MGLFEMYSKLTWGQTLNLNQLQILTAQDHGVVVIQGLHNTKDCRLAARRHPSVSVLGSGIWGAGMRNGGCRKFCELPASLPAVQQMQLQEVNNSQVSKWVGLLWPGLCAENV